MIENRNNILDVTREERNISLIDIIFIFGNVECQESIERISDFGILYLNKKNHPIVSIANNFRQAIF